MVPRPKTQHTQRKETTVLRKLLSRCNSWRMSSAQSQQTLEALQCHFTWDLNPSRSTLFRLRDDLEDIGPKAGYSWLGHIYNLQGFIHYQLGLTADAQGFFSRATEAFCQMRNAVSDEGPWLMVNYGNLAWLHHHLGEYAKSQDYLSKIDDLMNEYPSQEELHPEVYAEKAWTLMNFGKDKTLLAVDYFHKAIRMQPDVVEWQTSHVMALANARKHSQIVLDYAIMEKMRIAKEHDPENLYLAALYLAACAQRGKKCDDEIRALARRVLEKPVSSYNGIRPILRLHREYLSVDEGIDLVEQAMEKHPDERLLKWCAAVSYKWKIYSQKSQSLEPSMVKKAISLCEEVIPLYHFHSSLKMKIALANIYVKAKQQERGKQIYEELLQRESDLDPQEKQMFYNNYAKHLYFSQNDLHNSTKYHKEAAKIPQQSFYRENSIMNLEKIRGRNREIDEFLSNLQY